MTCNHEQLRCTDNVFFCVSCGAAVPSPFETKKNTPEEPKPAEGPKKPVKRTAKKKGE